MSWILVGSRAGFALACAAVLSACAVKDAPSHLVCGGEASCRAAELERAIVTQRCSLSPIGRDAVCEPERNPGAVVGVESDVAHVRLAYLEYDSHGHRYDPNQRTAIVDEIRRVAASGKTLLIVTYVHGWHHNASAASSNASDFPLLLARYADGLRHTNQANIEVLGVYVGWPGEITTAPILTQLSIGNRAQVADRVGLGDRSDGSTPSDAIADLHGIANAMRTANAANRMIVTGHSLGGRLLSRAFLTELERPDPVLLGPGVLMVTVNAAIDADAYRALYTESRTSRDVRRPLWINFTSSDDTATGNIYPLAIWSGVLPRIDTDHRQTRQTIGHYNNYVTHELGVSDCGAPNTDGKTPCGPQWSLSRLPSSPWTSGAFRTAALNYGPAASQGRPELIHCVLLNRYPVTPAMETALVEPTVCNGRFMKDFDRATASHPVPAYGRLWNVLTDKSLIDFDEPSFWRASTHNGWIQTDLAVMLLQLAFAPDAAFAE